MKSINPYNGSLLAQLENHTSEQVNEKLQHAFAYQQHWKQSSFAQRRDLLLRVSELMLEKQEELARLITLEMGKLIEQSRTEVVLNASVYRYYAENSEAFLQDEYLDVAHAKAYLRHEPLGVILGVMPWNFPLNQVARIAAPTIMAGNCVVVKHASIVPQCAQAIEAIFMQAGADSGLYTNLRISGKEASLLAADKRIAAVSLTGSEAAGSSFASAAAKELKKAVLELGGNDPMLITDDIDWAKQLPSILRGRFANMGQACTSAKRFIVHRSQYERLLAELKTHIDQLVKGDPMQAATTWGPLSSAAAAQELHLQVQEAIMHGAKCAIGGAYTSRDGAFYPWTVLTDISKDNPVYSQELFGPVASIYVVDSDQQAIDLANDSPYGLGASILCNDTNRAEEMARQIQTGMVFINRPVASRPDLPFGGIKRSGFGRELAHLGIREFINPKLIFIPE